MQLVLSIIINILFISNYWVCKYLYPNSNKDWNEFIPMDLLCHLFWTVIVFLSFVIARLKSQLTNHACFWLHASMGLSFLDVIDKFVWHIYKFTLADFLYILAVYTLSSVYYLYVRGKQQTI